MVNDAVKPFLAIHFLIIFIYFIFFVVFVVVLYIFVKFDTTFLRIEIAELFLVFDNIPNSDYFGNLQRCLHNKLGLT